MSATRCTYPDCNCPFDHPGTKGWCARGLETKDSAMTLPAWSQAAGFVSMEELARLMNGTAEYVPLGKQSLTLDTPLFLAPAPSAVRALIAKWRSQGETWGPSGGADARRSCADDLEAALADPALHAWLEDTK